MPGRVDVDKLGPVGEIFIPGKLVVDKPGPTVGKTGPGAAGGGPVFIVGPRALKISGRVETSAGICIARKSTSNFLGSIFLWTISGTL